ncbi:MAG: hypothetical protein QOJ99_5731 [Bryobacterales bacterium]|nr:hypothetical protein [Bryobacterales bacterium]
MKSRGPARGAGVFRTSSLMAPWRMSERGAGTTVNMLIAALFGGSFPDCGKRAGRRARVCFPCLPGSFRAFIFSQDLLSAAGFGAASAE